MKKVILYIFIFLMFNFVILAESGQILLEKNTPVTINNKNILFTGSHSSSIYMEVDGITDILPLEQTTYINGIEFYLLGTSAGNQFRDMAATLNYTMNFTCGNSICETTENNDICCTDCACKDDYGCFNNMCIESSFIECTIDADCSNDDPCTTQTCSDAQCSTSSVQTCIDDDECCPTNCDTSNDIDCFITECSTDTDCNDNNTITEDRCQEPGICKFYPLEIIPEVKEESITANAVAIKNAPKNSLQKILEDINWKVTGSIVLIFFTGFVIAAFFFNRRK